MPMTEAKNNTNLNLIDIFSSITSQSTMNKLLKNILEASFNIIGILRGSILLIDSNKFICCTNISLHECTNDIKIYETNESFDCMSFPQAIVNHVLNEKKELYIEDPYNNSVFSEDHYIKLHLPKAVLCLPIIRQNKVLAILYLEDIFSIIPIPEDKRQVLSTVINTAALAIENISIRESIGSINGSAPTVENVSDGLSIYNKLSTPTAANDITSEKLIQLELHERDERYKFLFELSPEAICVHDKGIIIMANPAAARLVGAEDINSLIGRNILDFVREDFKKLVRNRIDSIANGSSFLPCVEEKFLRLDGSIIDVEVCVAPFPCNGKTYSQVIVRDITEQKKIQLALKNSEDRYKFLVNMLPDAIYVIKDNRIDYSNKAGALLLGAKSPKEIIGKKRSDFALPIDKNNRTLQKVKKQLITKGDFSSLEESFLRKSDNLIIDIETSVINFSYGEDNKLVVCRNISERKKAELLQIQMEETNHLLNQTVEYDKLRTEFFANISHELRTPINIVLSSLQLFQLLIRNNPVEVEKLESYIETMKQNCYRLTRLVNNLIDVTKIDAGYLNVNFKNCNIVNIIEDISLSVVPYLQNKNISLIFDTDVEEKFMACDPDKMERIMLNLISNAFKFTNLNGTIHVTLKDLNDHIVISVKDNGIGIPKDKQELIFQRFIQIDKSLAGEHEGSGIGLSIVKSLVEMHGGTISLKSECGQGSEFIISLPVKLLDGDNSIYTKNNLTDRGNIDKINIELSDIYV